MVFSNADENTLRVFDPGVALGDDFDWYFKGLVLAILVFVGFEGAAPLAEEARDPRRTVPRAIVGSTLAIGVFVVFCAYATVVGFGFDEFAEAALAVGNPWVELGDVYWGAGWTLIFFAIVNSLLGLGNAVVNAASRIVYALGRNGAIPSVFARTHPTYRTPHVAIAATVLVGTAAALLAGWRWDLLTAITMAGVALTVQLMLIYIAVCVATFLFYWRERRAEFSLWLHGLVPLAAVVGLVAVVYYQYRPLPPYPIRYANWFVLGVIALGAVVTLWLAQTRRRALDDAGQVFVETDEAPAARLRRRASRQQRASLLDQDRGPPSSRTSRAPAPPPGRLALAAQSSMSARTRKQSPWRTRKSVSSANRTASRASASALGSPRRASTRACAARTLRGAVA